MRVLPIALSLLLTACGGGGTSDKAATSSNGSTTTTTPGYTLSAFTITPTSINPNDASNGAFTLSWTVADASAGNYMRMFFSADSTVSPTTDAQIFSTLCTPSGCGSSNTFTANCKFDQSNAMICDNLGGKDLTTYLTNGLSVSSSYYLILQSCSDPYVTCDTKAVAITLQ